MKVVEIRNIVRKDDAVLYRRTYAAEVLLEYAPESTQKARIEFVLEHTATDGVQINVSFIDQPNYPLVPALRELKQHILSLDSRGMLT